MRMLDRTSTYSRRNSMMNSRKNIDYALIHPYENLESVSDLNGLWPLKSVNLRSVTESQGSFEV